MVDVYPIRHMIIFKKIVLLFLFAFSSQFISAQEASCFVEVNKHKIVSKYLNQEREYWVSLPMNYQASKAYPVIYVLDAEWRFDLIRTIAYDLSGNKKMPHHIIVGIPHIEMEKQRGIDMTFSHSNIEYDGETVDTTWYNSGNSGGAMKFFKYLNNEVISDVGNHYKTNGNNILVGHSYGGYFGGYILSLKHEFTALQIYDPSMWFSEGEAEDQIKKHLSNDQNAHVFISYQFKPKYHKEKIASFIKTLSQFENIRLAVKEYPNETHNSLFMDSFIQGMRALYSGYLTN